MTSVFERIGHLSPSKQALLLRRLREKHTHSIHPSVRLAPLVPKLGERYDSFPLSEIQQAYWVSRNEFFAPDARGTNVYLEFDLLGVNEFTVPRLDEALQLLIKRHDMLRMIILPDCQQRVLPDVPQYNLTMRDLRGRQPPYVEATLVESRERMRYEKGPSDRWPLFEFIVSMLEDRHIRLQARIDALIIDGGSRRLLTQDLFRFMEDPHVILPPLKCTYRDYVISWRAIRESELYNLSRDYWLRRLPSLPSGPNLSWRRTADNPIRGRLTTHETILLHPDTWKRLKALATAQALSPSALVIAAFAEILTDYSDSPHFTLGLLTTYRPPLHTDIEAIVGNFNTLHLLEVADNVTSFHDRAKKLQDQLLTDLEYRLFSGFEVLREWRRHKQLGQVAVPIVLNSLLHLSSLEAGEANVASIAAADVLEIDASMYVPQVMLLSTVFEGKSGSLSCKWQVVENSLPDDLLTGLTRDYANFLESLTESESWKERRGTRRVRPQLEQSKLSPASTAESTNFIAPRNALELQLSQLWEELLDVKAISVKANFFELGGNSVLAIYLLIRIDELFHRKLPGVIMYEGGTIEHLAALLQQPAE